MGAQIEGMENPNNQEVLCNDNNQFKEQLNDFEIITFFDFKGDNNEFSWSEAKVRSLKSNKIYTMKRIYKDPQSIKFYKEEITKLKELDNPYIIKYYELFEDNNNFYLIMEYMNNSDINNFIETNKVFNFEPEEEILLKILLQCLSALVYLHSQNNLAESGIKLSNIFMDNEQNIKIGVFNLFSNVYSYNYDFKNDIYFLGSFFERICFLENQGGPKKIYSQELIQIINSMIENDPNKRWDAETLLNEVKKIYFKKYFKNTSIISILRCLYSFPDLNTKILGNNEIKQNIEKNNILNWYLKLINILGGYKVGELNENIQEFRFDFSSKYAKFLENKEINPFYFFIILLENMYKESNKINQINIQNEYQEGEDVINSVFNADEVDKENKEQMLKKFYINFNNNVNSYIANLFCGIMLTELKCDICDNIKYSFNNFCFLYYDLSKKNNEEQFNLFEEGFKINHLEKRLYCGKCLIEQKHFESNKYYKMPHQLVIYFNRGNNYTNTSDIIFEENLNLINYIEDKNGSPKDFYLVGSINRKIINEKEEEFIYYTRDPNNKNIWYISNMKDYQNYEMAPINDIKKNGQIIMLFYNNQLKENNNN